MLPVCSGLPQRKRPSRFFPWSAAGRIILLCCFALAARTTWPEEKGEFFVGAAAEAALYSVEAMAFGGGLTAGYGFDIGAIGIGLRYFMDTSGLTSYAPNLFVRFYLPPATIPAALKDRVRDTPRSGYGPFLQFDFGPSFHAWNPRIPADDLAGTVSAGLSAGWRFLLGKRWYVEPALRAGHPFAVGLGAAGGLRL